MKRTSMRGRGSGRIKARVLAIALVPSVAILAVGALLSSSLINQAMQVHGFAEEVRAALSPTTSFTVSLQEERRLTVLRLSDPLLVQGPPLDEQRARVDAALSDRSASQCMASSSGGGAPDQARAQIPEMRHRVDTGAASAQEAYDFYNNLLDVCGAGIQRTAQSAPDAAVGFEQTVSYDLFKAAEAMSRGHVMALRGITTGLTPEQFHELSHQLGMYHEQVESVVPRMTEAEQRQYAALKTTPAWAQLVAGDNSLMVQGLARRGPTPVFFDVPVWEDSAREVADGLIGLYTSHSSHAADMAAASSNRTLTASLAGGAGILGLAAFVVLIAVRQSRWLINRLSRLRRETLELADRGLPEVVGRLRNGERIDAETELPWLDHGDDELGQVANAFNEAQRTAITAAVQEAETRDGVREVFLNIAHRSQVIVHRQLNALDRAERSQHDPDQLQLLFELDHLATRSRRNAENLIILGGGQPGRRWRNPVSLRQVVRSAIAETEHYTRVNIVRLPEISMIGSVVADLIHLLAELVDNATSFSPPQCTVEVRGNRVGRGIVIEVEDQGLGIEPEQIKQINKMLHNPPDFSVMALSTDSRVGLFVVARLAIRHGIKITLRESVYAGTRAIVLIPSELSVATSPGDADLDALSRRPDAAPQGLAHQETQRQPAVPYTVQGTIPSRALTSGQQTDSPTDRWPVEQTKQTKNGHSPRRNGNAESNGNAEPKSSGAKGRPPLPKRQRQASLPPQLQEDDNATSSAAEDDGASRTPEQSRDTMTSFQQGTKRARADEPATKP